MSLPTFAAGAEVRSCPVRTEWRSTHATWPASARHSTWDAHSLPAIPWVVALVSAQLYPEYFDGPLLIDGGLPLDVPAGTPTGTAPVPTLGPAADRLSMTFPTRDSYLEFWRKHPAFASEWNEKVEDYVNYDLVGSEPELRASTSLAAMQEDSAELFVGESVLAALSELHRPLTLLTAPRGLLDETPGLYSPAAVARWREELPDITIREVADVNHYTIVMGSGATTVASALRAEVAAQR